MWAAAVPAAVDSRARVPFPPDRPRRTRTTGPALSLAGPRYGVRDQPPAGRRSRARRRTRRLRPGWPRLARTAGCAAAAQAAASHHRADSAFRERSAPPQEVRLVASFSSRRSAAAACPSRACRLARRDCQQSPAAQAVRLALTAPGSPGILIGASMRTGMPACPSGLAGAAGTCGYPRSAQSWLLDMPVSASTGKVTGLTREGL